MPDYSPPDVVWTCRLMARLTDRQLQGAFRAAGYPPDVAGRFVREIREKIRQGLAPDQWPVVGRLKVKAK